MVPVVKFARYDAPLSEVIVAAVRVYFAPLTLAWQTAVRLLHGATREGQPIQGSKMPALAAEEQALLTELNRVEGLILTAGTLKTAHYQMFEEIQRLKVEIRELGAVDAFCSEDVAIDIGLWGWEHPRIEMPTCSVEMSREEWNLFLPAAA